MRKASEIIYIDYRYVYSMNNAFCISVQDSFSSSLREPLEKSKFDLLKVPTRTNFLYIYIHILRSLCTVFIPYIYKYIHS